MKLIHYLIITAALLLLIAPVSAATENVSAGMTVTCKGPYDILVSLGLENVLPLAQARIWYNWISIGLIVMIAAMASSRTTRFVGILIPVMAALTMYFGWFTLNDPANPGKLFGVVVVATVLAVAIYMKDSLHEKFGIAGPGSMMFNIAFYIILLQATVGFVNATAIWDINAAPTTSSEYTNIDLQEEVTNINANVGSSNVLSDAGNLFTEMAFGVIQMFISIAAALIAFAVVLGIIYPWIPASQYGILMLGLIQLGIYIVYFMALMRFIYKPSGEGEF